MSKGKTKIDTHESWKNKFAIHFANANIQIEIDWIFIVRFMADK